MAALQNRKIINVSNRLPVSIHKGPAGIEYRQSPGGLATGLSSLQTDAKMTWIGWPGAVRSESRTEVEAYLTSTLNCYPVFMTVDLVEKYYEGFCNRTIWPIFHSMSSYAKYSAAEWEAFKKANALFARKIEEIYRPGDVLWIHDYQLMLLARLVREQIPHATMGFFLHIPFPHNEIFRLLPQHKEILDGLLAFDLIGFHTHDYAQAFLGSVRRILGHDNTLGQIMLGDRVVQVDVFPMGIDFKKYSSATDDDAVRDAVSSIRSGIGGQKVVFSVSRLDYTKGIPQSLEAIREFFTRHPDRKENVVFVLVVVPSRERVERYVALKHEIDELVGSINSEFGTLSWQPIRYIYRSLAFHALTSLYAAADVALVMPLRDGMNLIAKEYLAVRSDARGVLVLSEMAGAAKELLEAVLVNPNSKEEIAAALNRALTMPEEEQVRRNTSMRQRLETYDLAHWVSRYFARLDDLETTSQLLAVKLLDSKRKTRLMEDYTKAARRLLVLDYDGTLLPFASRPSEAEPDAALLSILNRLAAQLETRVVIMSGRDKESLHSWLGALPITLVAEHGGWTKPAGPGEWTSFIPPGEETWKKEIRPILDLFAARIPGSEVEEKTFSIVWHYRNADAESAWGAARELLDTLSGLTTNLNIQVLPGSKTVEVRNASINKGAFYSRFLSDTNADFILGMGDDWTDEDLFAVLPETAYSIRVTPRPSKARFNVRSTREARALLERLASIAIAPLPGVGALEYS